MIIYKCIITGDELFSDAFPIVEKNFFFEVEGKVVTRTEGFDESLISANASADEVQEGTDSSCVSGVDIVLNNRLHETCFKKKEYVAYLKDYMKAVKEKLQETNPERVEAFMKDAQAEVKALVAQFDKFQFFIGESMNPDGMVALLDYRDDEVTPYMIFFKDGLIVEKC